MISSCGFPESENFELLKRHFAIICEHLEWMYSGQILISGAGAANAPKLFDKRHELIRKADAELIQGQLSLEISDAIAAPVMSDDDYRRMVTLSFEGGLLGKAKMISIVSEAIRHGPQNSAPNHPSDRTR